MNDKQFGITLKKITQELVPKEVDLWPEIERKMLAERRFASQTMPPKKMSVNQTLRFRFGFAGLMIVLALIIFIGFTPSGQAFAQNVIRFFSQTTSDTLPAPTSKVPAWMEVSPDGSVLGEPMVVSMVEQLCNESIENCSLANLQNVAVFPLKVLSSLPDGFAYTDALGEPEDLSLVYKNDNDQEVLLLNQKLLHRTDEGIPQIVGASAQVENVRIGVVAGEYVQGSFAQIGGEALMNWYSDNPAQTLIWIEDGIRFVLRFYGNSLNKEDLIMLAERLTFPSAEHDSIPMATLPPAGTPEEEYPLTRQQAEEQLGYELLLPAILPENFQFVGIKIDAQTNIVSAFYGLSGNGSHSGGNGLLIKQAILDDTNSAAFSPFTVDSPTEVGEQPTGSMVEMYKTVQIEQSEAQYVEGTWAATDCCGWKWEQTPYLKRLRWQSNGIGLELLYMGLPDLLEEEDCIRIAENLQ
ncbi:MAG TPA: hypothetical protein DDX29_06880 [Clostridiales bacterium]|nr:hypothetical protein [Clostridiales bacterium]